MTLYQPAEHETIAEPADDHRPSLLQAVVMVLNDAGLRVSSHFRD